MSSYNRLLALGCATMLAACDGAPSAGGSAAPVLSATESSQRFGDYTVHFNALATNQLTAEIASQYGISRSQNRAMLNISVLRGPDGGSQSAVGADIDIAVSNLSGQVKNMTMRPITEGDAIYYIGEVAVTNGETLIFAIDVTPEGESESFSIRYRKQFFVD